MDPLHFECCQDFRSKKPAGVAEPDAPPNFVSRSSFQLDVKLCFNECPLPHALVGLRGRYCVLLMPVERKRKAANNESAVAKLRRFRASATPASSREESPSQQAAVTHKLRDTSRGGVSAVNGDNEVVQNQREKKLITTLPALIKAKEVSDENRFSVLPYKQSWDGNRTFERLSSARLRVELEDGMSLVVLGQCLVWVKCGVIAVAGAILATGPTRHKLSSSELTAIPRIDVVAGPVELELISIESALFSEQKSLGHTIPTVHRDLSFRVLGLDPHPAGDDTDHLRILSLNPTHFEPLSHAVRPRLVFCGSRSTGITTLARCVLNRVLTTAASQAALFIDLDPVAPQFVAPGMIGISQVNDPVLDQTFNRGGQLKARTLRQHFVGIIDSELSQSSWHERCFNDLMSVYEQVHDRHPEAGVIVCLPDGSSSPGGVEKTRLWDVLQPDRIVRIDPEARHSPETAELMEGDVPRVHTVPTVNENPHTSRRHALTMQNYLGSTILRQGQGVFQYPGSSIMEMPYRRLEPMTATFAQIDQQMPASWTERLLPATVVAIMVLSDHEHQKLFTCRRACKTSGILTVPALSTLSMDVGQVHCLGIGRVEDVDTVRGTVSLRTPIVPQIRDEEVEGKVNLLLVLQPPSKDGRYGL
jgi:polynucleotide 5'-kinase involved in rRNA processing